MKVLSAVSEVVGLLIVILGFYLFDWRAGLVAAGVSMVLLAWAMDPPERRRE